MQIVMATHWGVVYCNHYFTYDEHFTQTLAQDLTDGGGRTGVWGQESI